MVAVEYTIGGSEVAAAAGVHPHMSAVELYLRKTGAIPDEGNEAVRWGTLLGPIIAAELVERGVELMPYPADGARDPQRPWATGHPDGLTVIADEYAVVEIKTAGVWAHKYRSTLARRLTGSDPIPLQHEAQMQWYMHLTGLPRGLWACLIGGQRLETQVVERNPDAIALLLKLAEHFYACLMHGEPPAPDGSESARDALLTMYPHATEGRKVRLDSEHMATLRELRIVRETGARVAEQRAKLENELKAVMGDAELAITPNDNEAIRWTDTERRALDVERLKRDRPEIYAEYLASTSTRRFTVL